MASAETLFPSIPNDHRDRVAHFLESQGHKELALRVSTDADHKFELSIQLGRLDLAHEIAKESDSQHKWRQLGDLALTSSEFDLAEQCLTNASDLNGLLLLYTTLSNGDGLEKLAEMAKQQDKYNVAFMSYFLSGHIDKCLDVLCSTGRIPEAAFFARTYMPSQVSRVVKLWRENLQKVNPKAAESLADPMEYENLFPDIRYALRGEEALARERSPNTSASSYLDLKHEQERDIIADLKSLDEEEALEGAADSSNVQSPDVRTDNGTEEVRTDNGTEELRTDNDTEEQADKDD